MTKADFFLGRGRDSVWLGSVGSHGRPEMLNREIVCAGSREAFKRAVGAMVRTLAQGVPPEMGWPWRNGRTTEYTYAFDDGEIFVSVSGGPWFHLHPWRKEEGVGKPRHLQPRTPFTQKAADKADGNISRRSSPHSIARDQIRRRLRGRL
jgi:hypothetical protein